MTEAAPCFDCGTTGGEIKIGRDTPSRISGKSIGYNGLLCYHCYNRNYKRYVAAGNTVPEKHANRTPVVDLLEHQGLVRLVARKYANRGIDLDDLIGWGNVALVMASKAFDPSLGNQFSTYAVAAINSRILRVLADHVPLIRIPSYLQKSANKGVGDSDPSSRLSAAVAVRRCRRVPEHNLDRPLTATAVSREKSPESRAETAELAAVVLASLPPIEARVLKLRFGIGGDPETNKEIGQRLGVSRETVRAIEARAIERIRRERGVPA